ncbi:beta-N-acetylhexosaminidase [Anditalea andensis]|uniref:beta-N-acetylhexosaminidase n=1 Tax=Anditalea andensis TaxID=1048983 RepID=A0A074LKF8_9BACT|nr:glycoside hydrolase family 20 protein [Anditalea andensis]KEO74317.1 beta-N-acetylhexosaminidase [Anditalea andensis]
MIYKTKIFSPAFFVFSSICCCLLFFQACTPAKMPEPLVSLIPKPTNLNLHEGHFTLNKDTKIIVDPDEEGLYKIAGMLAIDIETQGGILPEVIQGKPQGTDLNYIHLTLSSPVDTLANEGYYLKVSGETIILAANDPQGMFWGSQTIRQLLPAQPTKVPLQIAALEILDKPRYSWRGMHLDVGRHFYPVSFIKKYLDYMAMHKMNTFHWHLTEDQGWRIEIKKYPKLTEIGSRREQTLVGHAGSQPYVFDEQPYGGYYSQEEIREIVQYAQDRYITVVPEIEMPGHSLAALAAYPELSCTGGPFKVAGTWGVFEDVYCAGNEATFTFLEDVLTEVMDLFPGAYVHIGGDESPKARWEKCPKCQARIKEEGLKDEHELQSYFIQRMEKFLNAHDKKIIGWDEILEGGLAPNAAVMSWRGMEGGIAAAEALHDVVMTPGSHVYFDHYQGEPSLEPLAFGGYTPLHKVYAFEPTPETLSKEQQRFILGAQANVWSEYIPTTEQVEYMIMPRMSALAEVLWTPAADRNWEDFMYRMQQQYRRFDAMGVNYSKSAFQVRHDIKVDSVHKEATVTFKSDAAGVDIRYSLDGSAPTPASRLYTVPFTLSESAIIKAATFQNDELMGQVTERTVDIHQAFGAPVTLSHPPHANYTGSNGSGTLVNGLAGSTTHTDGAWLGFLGVDLEAVIDLQSVKELSAIRTSFLQQPGAHIFLPAAVEYAVSEDGTIFNTIDSPSLSDAPAQGTLIQKYEATFPATKAQFIRVRAANVNALPWDKEQRKRSTWLFVDEMVVE